MYFIVIQLDKWFWYRPATPTFNLVNQAKFHQMADIQGFLFYTHHRFYHI